MDKSVVQVEDYRQALISYVYRIIGCFEDSKDIVQDTYLKYISFEKDISNTKAWMYKVATNLSFDFLKKAKRKKELYIGPWLPEPYIEDSKEGFDEIQLDESLSIALLVLMEKLSARERVAYILHDLFDFKHKEIADILNTSNQNSRQLNSRANKKLKDKRGKYRPSKDEHIKLTNSFLSAVKKGDFLGLQEIFRADVELYSDGGGKAIAARKVLYGDDEFISKFLVKVTAPVFGDESVAVELKPIWFNGSLGLLLIVNDKIQTSYSFEIQNEKIAKIFVHRNPDKLHYFKNYL